jgi:hypothetical protein
VGDLLTYSLSAFLPFSRETYYRLFALHNAAIWPAQIAAYGFGVASLVVLIRRPAWGGRMVAAVLAGGWFLCAWQFHWAQFEAINWGAGYYAVGFVAQGIALLIIGAAPGRMDMPRRAVRHPGFYVFALVLVVPPLAGLIAGRDWREVELFGVAPDPLVIATLGFLLLPTNRTYWELLIVPFLWCAITSATNLSLDAWDGVVVPAVAVPTLGFFIWRHTTRSRLDNLIHPGGGGA